VRPCRCTIVYQLYTRCTVGDRSGDRRRESTQKRARASSSGDASLRPTAVRCGVCVAAYRATVAVGLGVTGVMTAAGGVNGSDRGAAARVGVTGVMTAAGGVSGAGGGRGAGVGSAGNEYINEDPGDHSGLGDVIVCGFRGSAGRGGGAGHGSGDGGGSCGTAGKRARCVSGDDRRVSCEKNERGVVARAVDLSGVETRVPSVKRMAAGGGAARRRHVQ
jgi:hypothetical protein